jgi:hypothetical protein
MVRVVVNGDGVKVVTMPTGMVVVEDTRIGDPAMVCVVNTKMESRVIVLAITSCLRFKAFELVGPTSDGLMLTTWKDVACRD